jgi:hypothetical protein
MAKEILVSASRYDNYLLQPAGKIFSLNGRKYMTAGYDRFTRELNCHPMRSNGEVDRSTSFVVASRGTPSYKEDYRILL